MKAKIRAGEAKTGPAFQYKPLLRALTPTNKPKIINKIAG